MGNSHSQSLSRFTPSLLHNNSSASNQKEGRTKKPSSSKFASPENRVLPIVSNVPQRLRSTDNGSILQSGGTISGRKTNSVPIPGAEPEFVQLLQKKCNALQSTTQNVSFQTLYGHRKSHSDPDIVRMMMIENENDSDDEEDDDTDGRGEADGGSSNQRSIIAVSPSKAKIKSRKKKRAPEPPQSNTLPRSLNRAPVNYKSDSQRKPPSSYYDCNDAPRRPLPPIPPEEMPPPPPPPPPDYNRSCDERGVMKTLSKNYEKNRRTVDKWKFSKTSHDTSLEKVHRQRSKSLDRTEDQKLRNGGEDMRNERFDRNNSMRNVSSRNDVDINSVENRNAQHSNDALRNAIADAARRRAERLETAPREYRNPSFKSSMKHLEDSRCNTEQDFPKCYSNGLGKQYTHLPPDPYKQADALKSVNSKHHRYEIRTEACGAEKNDIENFPRRQPQHQKQADSRKDYKSDERRRNEKRSAQRQSRSSKFAIEEQAISCSSNSRQSKWDTVIDEPIRRFLPDGTPSSSSTSEEEMEIDLQLRPTLPRRPIEMPKFSPTDVWKSINLDFFKSHQQRSDISSDEGDDVMEEKIHRINRPVAPRRLIHDRSADSGISPDAGSPVLINEPFENLLPSNNNGYVPPTSAMVSEEKTAAWIPQHDLADDSECGTDDSPVTHGNKPPPIRDGQAKFAMPNLMFASRSLPRTDQKNNITEEAVVSDKERTRSRGRKKKSYRNADGQHFNSLRNLKKALGLRSKPPVVEDTEGLDLNWSLSRSLPNFINNLNTESIVKQKHDIPDASAMDLIRRTNSESRTLPQENGLQKTCNGLYSPYGNPQWRKSFPGQTSEGHVIYLPEYSSNAMPCQPTTVVDDNHVNTDSELVIKKPNGRKKFSYQSTVRQEEKKKLEERLAREVEARERKRQEEIEWMNKVEEEFRKQRDKEKVNIRHQLRILNLQEKAGENNQPTRKQSNRCDVEYIDDHPKNIVNDHKDHATHYSENEQNTSNAYQDASDTSYNWKQPTGMRKWLRRQNRDYRGINPTRPEPEGGRSSSDDCKQMDGKRETERNHSHRLSYQTNGRKLCSHGRETYCDLCHPPLINSSITMRSENQRKPPSTDVRSSNLASSAEAKKVERHKSAKEQLKVRCSPPVYGENISPVSYLGLSPDANNELNEYIRESVEEYELHTRLCRTNSGRTFESHSYYALERRKEDAMDYDAINKTSSDSDRKANLFSTLNFEKELKENVMKKTRDVDKRNNRKYQSCDSDDSGSDGREVRYQRPTVRNQKKKSCGDTREPSFSRNHPHRNGARAKSQLNGHAVNGRTSSYTKAQNNHLYTSQQRIAGSVMG